MSSHSRNRAGQVESNKQPVKLFDICWMLPPALFPKEGIATSRLFYRKACARTFGGIRRCYQNSLGFGVRDGHEALDGPWPPKKSDLVAVTTRDGQPKLDGAVWSPERSSTQGSGCFRRLYGSLFQPVRKPLKHHLLANFR